MVCALSLATAGATALVAAPATADASSAPLVSASLKGSSLTLNWADDSGFESFVVVNEHTGRVVQAGAATTFSRRMEQADSTSLVVYALRDGVAALAGKVQAITPEAGSPLVPAVAVTSQDGVKLDWHATPGVSTWTVESGSGSAVAATDATQLQLPTDFTRERRFDIIGQTLVDGVVTKLVTGFAVAPPVVPESAIRPDAAQGDMVAMGVVNVSASRFHYDAYIPDAHVDAPDSMIVPMDCESGDGSNYWYGGDNRGPEYNSPRYRTRAVNQYTWGVAMITEKHVAPTTRYVERNGQLYYESSRQASDAGMAVQALSMERGRASGAIAHSIGNPYCHAANNIDYRQNHEVYQTGGYRVSGWHDKMPNHHFYRRTFMSDGSYVDFTVFHHELVDPKCLNAYWQAGGGCPAWEYQYVR